MWRYYLNLLQSYLLCIFKISKLISLLSHKYSYFFSTGNRRKRFNPATNMQILQQQFIKSIAPNRTKRQSPMREQLCETKSNYINPQAALNARGNWMYIVNGVDSATQLVKTETCA